MQRQRNRPKRRIKRTERIFPYDWKGIVEQYIKWWRSGWGERDYWKDYEIMSSMRLLNVTESYEGTSYKDIGN